MSHRKRQGKSRVLIDVATAMRLTHPRHVGQAQGLTRLVDLTAEILSGNQNRILITTGLQKLKVF